MAKSDGYLADEDVYYRYPAAGDPMPPSGTKLLLLTRGGICIIGHWIADGFFIAWAPLPKRDKTKEHSDYDRAQADRLSGVGVKP